MNDPQALDDDALVALVRTIGEARSRLAALGAKALEEVDRLGLPRRGGHVDVVAWLAELTHVHEATARRRSDAAATLASLPEMAAALATGSITADHVDRLAPV